MCLPGYHHNGFVATHGLGHMMYSYVYMYVIYILHNVMYILFHFLYKNYEICLISEESRL